MPRTHTLVACLAAIAIVVATADRVPGQGGFTLNDSETVPGPGDIVVVVNGRDRWVITLSRDTDEAYTHKLGPDGSLTPVGASSTGDGSLAATLTDSGHVVVANSLSNVLSVMKVQQDGLLEEKSRVPSGGEAPSDVARFEDLIIVANRGALTGEGEGVSLFRSDGNGNLEPISALLPTGPQPSPFSNGNDPHVIAVGGGGLVAVGNSNSNDVTLFEVGRGGNVQTLGNLNVGDSPKALAFRSDTLYVGTRAPVFGATQDQIQEYAINRDGSVSFQSTTDAGFFLTDLELLGQHLFAVTWENTTGSPEVRQYDIGRRGGLTQTAALTLPNNATFQQIALHVAKSAATAFVSQFQANALHSLTVAR